MVIKNSTIWSTDDLRKLFRRTIKEVEKVEKPKIPFHRINKHYQLTIKTHNRNADRTGGRAELGELNSNWNIGRFMRISIPYNWNLESELEIENKIKLVHTIIHEYLHNIGIRSIDYRYYAGWNKQKNSWNVDWVKDYPVRKKQILIKEKIDIKLERYERAISNMRRAETRLRRAKTLWKKWKSKTAYYEKICGSPK